MYLYGCILAISITLYIITGIFLVENYIKFLLIIYSFETSDGVSRSEQAELKNIGTEQEALSVRGSISWIAADGETYTLNFLADENGFQPEGAHIPKV